MPARICVRDAYEFRTTGKPCITICVEAENMEDARVRFLHYMEELRIQDPERWVSDFRAGNIDAFECTVIPQGNVSITGECQRE